MLSQEETDIAYPVLWRLQEVQVPDQAVIDRLTNWLSSNTLIGRSGGIELIGQIFVDDID